MMFPANIWIKSSEWAFLAGFCLVTVPLGQSGIQVESRRSRNRILPLLIRRPPLGGQGAHKGKN
jgi:hypothetical protein